MKQLTLIILLFITVSCSKDKMDLIRYNHYLGDQKANALSKGVAYFDDFLHTNYPNLPNQGLRTQAFLNTLKRQLVADGKDSIWVFDSIRNQEILNLLETSGMRQEVRRYGYEIDPNSWSNRISISMEIEGELKLKGIDSTPKPFYNERIKQIERESAHRIENNLWKYPKGKYLQGLKRIQTRDERLKEYIETVELMLGPSLIASVSGALEGYQPSEYEDPFVKRIIFVEIFWVFMNIEKNRSL